MRDGNLATRPLHKTPMAQSVTRFSMTPAPVEGAYSISWEDNYDHIHLYNGLGDHGVFSQNTD